MPFEIIGEVNKIETIAASRSLRELKRVRRQYGGVRWRKLKGIALIRLENGTIWLAELHWYESHGVGRKEMKIKRLLENRS